MRGYVDEIVVNLTTHHGANRSGFVAFVEGVRLEAAGEVWHDPAGEVRALFGLAGRGSGRSFTEAARAAVAADLGAGR